MSFGLLGSKQGAEEVDLGECLWRSPLCAAAPEMALNTKPERNSLMKTFEDKRMTP
jgi:hypothetical protein